MLDTNEFFRLMFPESIFGADVFWTLGWVFFGKFFAIWLLNWNASNNKTDGRVFKVEISQEQRAREVRDSWHIGGDAFFLYLLLRFDLFKIASPSISNSIVTFVLFFLWVEVFTYFVHRAMHTYKLLFKLHRVHHISLVVTPFSTWAFSFSEMCIFSGGWIAFIALASWFVDVSLPGIVAYYVFNYLITVGGHSNVETSPASLTLTKFGLGSPTSHALHHARFKVNYGFSTIFLDRIFGTYSDETGDLQARAILGDGNESIKRRAAASTPPTPEFQLRSSDEAM